MRKKLFVMISLCFLTSGFAQAASLHGDFEGNPIVAVKSGGKDLKVEDVPAINYKDRTMVPIYLLRQLGAEVSWNSDTYSVNVAIPNQAASQSQDPEVKNRLLLKDTYQILSDFDYSMWMFVDMLQIYSNVDNLSNYLPLIGADYDKLLNQYNDSIELSKKVMQTIKSNQIESIMKSEAIAMNQLTQCKDLLINQVNYNNNPQMVSDFKINMLNTIRTVHKNIDNTKELQHDLLSKEMGMSLK